MSDAGWLIGWGAMLFVLHLVVALPALALMWWLRMRGGWRYYRHHAHHSRRRRRPFGLSGIVSRPFPAALAVCARLLLASMQLGVMFSPWNLAPAALTAVVVFYSN